MQAEASFPRRAETLRAYAVLARVSPGYPPLPGRLPTCSSPVRRSTRRPKPTFSLDLHVLSTPPAFILSQDQTLQLKILNAADRLSADSDFTSLGVLRPRRQGGLEPKNRHWLFLYSVFKEPTKPLRAIFKHTAPARPCQRLRDPSPFVDWLGCRAASQRAPAIRPGCPSAAGSRSAPPSKNLFRLAGGSAIPSPGSTQPRPRPHP